ncbi:hypothetical protein [Gracilibacillus phocaeensis]|uniref:hypothetical protein n=1 Tax=Gracilibacillus phocaeensis TaxID=2042304 RepID=UPI0010301FAF|nr:hypothetical protein [Gracilibacillus phocaeensis]
MIADEILSSLLVVGGVVGLFIIIFILSKIPGAGLIARLIRGLFLIVWRIVLLALTFFMFFMIGYMVIVFFTFNGSEEGILYQGESINFLIGDDAKHAAYFIMVYAGFSLVCLYVLAFILAIVRKGARIVGRFRDEAILVIMLLLVYTVFPTIVETILPDFEVGRYGTYALGVLPITMYIQGRISKVRKRNGRGRYRSRKDEFYRDLGEKSSF